MHRVRLEENSERHECEAREEGGWIIYHCPLCPDYERRVNVRTGDMEAKNMKAGIDHSGSYVPEDFGTPSGWVH